MTVGRLLSSLLAFVAIGASTAAAQENNMFALGASFTARSARSNGADASNSIGVAWRLGHASTGWGFSTGLGWFSTEISQPIGGDRTSIGELHIRPFLAGYGYSYAFRRVTVSANLLGGFAWTRFRQAPSAADLYRDRLGARSLNINASSTLIVKPNADVWVDIGRRVGVSLSAGYAVVRPSLTTRSSLGEQSRRVRADALIVSGGIVYKIF